MLHDYPAIIVDNFFKYPLSIREFAKDFEFKPDPDGYFSGTRSTSLHLSHSNFFKGVCNKILDCYSIPHTKYNASMYFHLTGEEFGNGGWIHQDGCEIASIIYLNPSLPDIKTGTTISYLNNFDYLYPQLKDMRQSFIDSSDDIINKSKHNQNFLPTINIGNVFNRMVSYDGRSHHAGSGYFGSNPDSSRLTLISFFHDIETEHNRPPLRRAERNSNL